jgi:cytoskeletal protein RodZ
MDEFDKRRRKQEAWRRLRAQQRRAGQLRGRVVAISLLSFVLLWAVVFVQMETGNDPVLGDNSAVAAVNRSNGSRVTTKTKAHPAEAEARTESEGEIEAQALEAEAAEAEFAEAEALEGEPEAVEAEAEVLEAEAELEPLTTSQS